MGPRDVRTASKKNPRRQEMGVPRRTTETAGGLRQTSLYLRPEEFEALYRRAAEETAERGVRVSIGEIMRRALREYLRLR